MKRSTSNKISRHLVKSSSPIIDTSTIRHSQVDFGMGTVHLDSHAPCLKANLELKSQKVLKRDLLRCSDQRPSLLGSHTLQPPRMHHGPQSIHATSSSADAQQSVRRHSISMHSHTFYTTIDRIGPWPDISISRLRSDGNEFLRPLKNFRSLKNPRVFSPKYYAGLTENTSKFKFYSTTKNYIDEYRKQKGYSLSANKPAQINSLSSSTSLPVQVTEDEQISAVGTFSSVVVAETQNRAPVDRFVLPTMELPPRHNGLSRTTNEVLEHTNTPPSIPAVTKVYYDSHHVNNFPTISMRNGHLRPTRQPVHHTMIAQQSPSQQAISLPSVTASSLHYISSMNSIEKAYTNSKKLSTPKQSKVFFIDGRNRKRYEHIYCSYELRISFFNKNRISQRFNSDSEV